MVTLSSQSEHGAFNLSEVGNSALGTEAYELWEPAQLRRLISLYEEEVERLNHRLRECQEQAEHLQQWRTDVERSRAWRLLGLYRAVVNRVNRSRPPADGR